MTTLDGPGTVTFCDSCHRPLEVVAWGADAVPSVSIVTPAVMVQHRRRCRMRAFVHQACRITHEIGGADDALRRS